MLVPKDLCCPHVYSESGLFSTVISNKQNAYYCYYILLFCLLPSTHRIDFIVFLVEGYELNQGQEVLCIGYSSLPSHVSIAYQNDILDLPYDKTSIKVCRPNDKTDISSQLNNTLTKRSDASDLNFYTTRRSTTHLVASEM